MDAIEAQVDALLLDARRGALPGAAGDAPDRPDALVSKPLPDVLVPTAPSASPTAVAIDGAGFFVVERAGHRFYTRLGDLRVMNGNLVDAQGRQVLGFPSSHADVEPTPLVVKTSTGLAIDAKGLVTIAGVHGATAVGRIALAIFSAPERLGRVDATTLRATAQSGPPRFALPGAPNVGALKTHALENGLVDVEADLERLWLVERRADTQAAARSADDSCERDAMGLVH